MCNVVGSEAEAKICSAYINAQEAIPICMTITKMGHPQPSTPIQVNNSPATEFANGNTKQKQLKAIYTHFYWIKDRTQQGQFLVCWVPGTTNLADYHMKHHSPAQHHSPAHHRLMRPIYIHLTTEQLANNLLSCLLRGRVNSSKSVCTCARMCTSTTWNYVTATSPRTIVARTMQRTNSN
jgi:hypothetical protein